MIKDDYFLIPIDFSLMKGVQKMKKRYFVFGATLVGATLISTTATFIVMTTFGIIAIEKCVVTHLIKE